MAKSLIFILFLMFFGLEVEAGVIEFTWDSKLSGVPNDGGEPLDVKNTLLFDDESEEVIFIKLESDIFSLSVEEHFKPVFEDLTFGDTYWYLTNFELNAADKNTGENWNISFLDFNIFMPKSSGNITGSPIGYLDQASVSIHTVLVSDQVYVSGYNGDGIVKTKKVNEPLGYTIFLLGVVLMFFFSQSFRHRTDGFNA